jgi:hypothetical protein
VHPGVWREEGRHGWSAHMCAPAVHWHCSMIYTLTLAWGFNWNS